ncbi:MKL myocardin 2 isoform X1 [Brachionus plicatilis]|uniref:MKL myocardin 2 isoform X1 n=1 Tax=Brachionus plicatilis TaxID=10195 RepID=A0A3M7PR72_BRAPC|nr:MKL myocardin 2 isoform X1 [Brachionus plicatilis]
MQSSSVLIVPASQSSEQKSTVIFLPNFIPFGTSVNKSAKPVKKERPIKPNLKPKPSNELKVDLVLPKSGKRRKSRSGVPPKKQRLNSVTAKQEKVNGEPCKVEPVCKTEFSQRLFGELPGYYSLLYLDSIEYLSTNWNSILSSGNDTDPKVLEKFRQFHCADCLKSFQDQQHHRVNMNTPPPPLQPIYEDTINGLSDYFGPGSGQAPNLRLLSQNSQSDVSNFKTPNGQEIYNFDLQEKKISLSRKLAQRRPKQELVERGILPSSRLPMQQYDQLKHLEKAQLQDILENKLEKRPNREILVQKNILPDSKAAPSLQLKCNELKRARLADDLNEKLAKRPGPLELIESGILISPDTSLTEAIKGGKIIYPKTSLVNRHHPYNRTDFLNDSALNLNFNLTDNEDSNASQASTSTTKTMASLSSSSITSFNFLPQNDTETQSSFKNLPSPFTPESADSPSKMSNKSAGSRRPKSSTGAGPSNATVSNKSNKKTLIFHQYLGPNQKISKTTLKSKPVRTKSKSSSSSLISELTSNEINSDNNSNDSTNYEPQEELNAYKIRLEQQKMYLSFNNSPKQVESVEVEADNKAETGSNFATSNQPIQLVPIGDVKMLDNFQSLISNGLMPFGTISLLNNADGSNPTLNAESKMEMDTETKKEVNGLNLEEMSVNKLREECSKRKLSKSGVKQKLIDRLKEYAKKELSKQVIKSPDSGVNLDNSPSFASCESSPIGKRQEPKLANLDSFFDVLNVETMGTDAGLVDEKDVSQTALTLEQSLKNSAELLKQLSSAGQLDHLHKLEKQMQQSMQLIEKLKLASKQSGSQSTEAISQNNPLRLVNSMPSNLRDLGHSSMLDGFSFQAKNQNGTK